MGMAHVWHTGAFSYAHTNNSYKRQGKWRAGHNFKVQSISPSACPVFSMLPSSPTSIIIIAEMITQRLWGYWRCQRCCAGGVRYGCHFTRRHRKEFIKLDQLPPFSFARCLACTLQLCHRGADDAEKDWQRAPECWGGHSWITNIPVSIVAHCSYQTSRM